MNEFLRSKRLYMLFVLPFLVVAIIGVGRVFRPIPLKALPVEGCIDLGFLYRFPSAWSIWLGGLAVLGIAYLIFFVNERFKLLQQTSTLPALLYILLISGMLSSVRIDALLMAVWIVVIAVWQLQLAINETKGNRSLFDFGALMALAVAIYPKFVILLLWALCVPFFSGRSTLRDFLALCLGIITPLVFLAFGYFWIDRLADLPDIFVRELFAGDGAVRLPVLEWTRLGILALLLLVVSSYLGIRYSILSVSERRGMLMFFSMLCFLVLTAVCVPITYSDFIYILACPLAFVYSHFFVSCRLPILGNLLFLLFLSACFLDYLQ